MSHTVEDITRWLQEARRGDARASNCLLDAVYGDLRAIAHKYMRDERPGHTLQPTALVHEAFLRIFQSGNVDWRNRVHFFAVAARQMRRLLVDHARLRKAERRGGGLKVSLEDVPGAAVASREQDVELVDELLCQLAKRDPKASNVVEMKFFGGMTDEDVAETLQVSLSTVRRDWIFARSWLFREMEKARDA